MSVLICETCRAEISYVDDSVAAVSCPRCHSRWPVPRRSDVTAAPTATAAQPVTAPSPIVGMADDAAGAPAKLAGYEMLGVIAQGGMGMVIKGRHLALNRYVAIKMPLYEASHDSELYARFLREGRAAARLQHPFICPIYEVGEHRRRPYIAMAFVDGLTVGAWSRAEKRSHRVIAEMMAKVTRAVAYAHQHGVVHRDIKPGNIMIDRERGEPWLMDFGLAKDLSDDSRQMTQSGEVMGTPAYMAPEQAAGRAHEIGPLSDVYSLGAVLYELICGQPPFVGAVGEVLSRVQTSDVVSPRKINPQVHRDLETICLKAIAKQPRDRYASAVALAEDLERFYQGESILAKPEGVARKIVRLASRNRRAVAVTAIITVLSAVAVMYLSGQARTSRKISQLMAKVDERIENQQWDGAAVSATEDLIGQLNKLAPQHGRNAAAKFHAAWYDNISLTLRLPELSAEQVAAIEHDIGGLSSRDAGRGDQLRQSLAERLRAWQQVAFVDATKPDAESQFASRVQKVAGGVRAPISNHVGWAMQKLGGHREVEAEFILPNKPKADAYVVLETGRNVMYFLGVQRIVNSDGAPMLRLTIRRDASVLRAEDRADVPDRGDKFKISGQMKGGALRLSVNDGAPLEFTDYFAAVGDGRAGVTATTDGAVCTQIRLLRQASPAKPTPLETGDEHFVAARFNEALDAYRHQVARAEDPATRTAARFKEGLTLLALNRARDAEEVLNEVRGTKDKPWNMLAGVHLWVHYIRERRAADADAMFAVMESQLDPRTLSSMLPQDVQEYVQRDFATLTTTRGVMGTVTAADIDRLERAQMMLERVSQDRYQHFLLILALERAYMLTGQPARDRTVIQQWLGKAEQWRVPPTGLVKLIEDLGWADRQLAEMPAVEYYRDIMGSPRGHPAMNIELARLYLKRGETLNAHKALDAYLATKPEKTRGQYVFVAHAWLIKGILIERAGDRAKALECFKNAALDPDDPSFQNMLATPQDLVIASIAGALSGEWSAQKADKAIAAGLSVFGRDAGMLSLVTKGVLKIPPKASLRAWEGPRGREAAEHIILRTVPMAEVRDLAMQQILAGFFLESLIGAKTSTEDEAFVYDVSQTLTKAFMSGKIDTPQVMLLGSIYKGTGITLLWPQLAASTDPSLRGRLAGMLGVKMKRLGQTQESQMFLEAALRDAPADSPTAAYARKALGRE